MARKTKKCASKRKNSKKSIDSKENLNFSPHCTRSKAKSAIIINDEKNLHNIQQKVENDEKIKILMNISPRRTRSKPISVLNDIQNESITFDLKKNQIIYRHLKLRPKNCETC